MNFLALCAGVFLTLTASLPAQAQWAGRDQPRRMERQQVDRQQQGEFRRQREFRRDEELQRRRDEDEGRQGRLTPEERQQLRRDIREHGRDVYRDRPRRF